MSQAPTMALIKQHTTTVTPNTPVSTHSGLANKYFSDFHTNYDHYFHYPNLPSDRYDQAKVIVDALNRLKGEAWAYALAVIQFPGYNAHPLRALILAEVKMAPEIYDDLIATMRKVHQD